MARSASTMKAAFGRLFRDRQILVRSDHGVRHFHVRVGHQVVAAGLLLGIVAWGLTSTLAYKTARDRVAEQAGQIFDLEIGYARLITDLANRRTSVADAAEELSQNAAITRHIVDRNSVLERRIDVLERELAEREAARAALSEHIESLDLDLAAAAERRRELESRIDVLTADAEALVAARDELIDEGRSLRADVVRLEQSLADAETLNRRLDGQIDDLTSAVQAAFTTVEQLVGERMVLKTQLDDARSLAESEGGRADRLQGLLHAAHRAAGEHWRERNALIDRKDALRLRVARLERELAGLQEAQEQLLAELRERTDLHIEAVEEGLSFTGLDVDGMIEELNADLFPGTGGPMIPTDAAAIEGALDLMSMVGHAANLRNVINRLPLTPPLQDRYRLSSRFGTRSDPFTGRRSAHEGLDFAAKARTPVYAPAPGRVVSAGRMGAYGNLVAVDHGLGIVTRYAHLHRIDVEAGQTIAAGDRIGLLGTTGRSTGPHLHYEVLVDGQPHNPANFLKAGKHVFQVSNE
ncbi:MAG TPA: peptidoglycan DD-metalloendopeptidase family protein [Alphaproteobacteria bacterium]|nr:peptidoglycan DD-metalloendopeptidase family protein [Alphaproteobacteria bacterium]